MGQLKIVCAQLGPIDTNTYILMDDEIKEAIIIDPAGSPEELDVEIEDNSYQDMDYMKAWDEPQETPF